MRPRWPWLVVMPLAVSIAVIAAAWNTRSAEPANAAAVLGPVPVPADNPQTPEKVALGKLLFFDPPFDRYRAGDKTALTAEQKAGMRLFFGPRTGCSSCHVVPLFTDNQWHNLGVPQVGPKVVDNGRSDITHNPADLGAFKTLTLRNVELTGPYMHDGVFATLDQVVAFYVGGGGPSPNKDPLIRPLDLDTKEQKAIVAFLRSLTDP